MHLMAVCDCCGGVKVFKVHITVAMAKKQISDKVNILSPKLSVYLKSKCFAYPEQINEFSFLKSTQV